MYKKILVALDATAADQTILEHVTKLALTFGSSLVLLHVADGWAARLFGAEAVSPKIEHDKAYLESIRSRLAAAGIPVEAELTYGEPADQIIRWIECRGCDLVAMSTHGHRFISDLLYGSTADNVRHHVDVPVLMLKAKQARSQGAKETRSQETGQWSDGVESLLVHQQRLQRRDGSSRLPGTLDGRGYLPHHQIDSGDPSHLV